MKKECRKIIGVLAFFIGVFVLMNSQVGITGNVVSERVDGVSSVFSLILIFVGIGLMTTTIEEELEENERAEKRKPRQWRAAGNKKALGNYIPSFIRESDYTHETINPLNIGERIDETFEEVFPGFGGMSLEKRGNPDKKIDQHKRRRIIGEALGSLSPRNASLIRDKYGLNEDEREYTVQELTKKYSVTDARIRQIEGNAFRKLRHPKNLRKLKKLR